MLPKPVRKIYYGLLSQKPFGEWLVYVITFFYHMGLLAGNVKPKQDRTALIIISHKYKFIYIGVPKVASRAFMGALVENGQEKYDTEWFETSGSFRHILGKYPDYFKFSFVRSPWARIVSCYNSKIAEGVTYSKYVRIMAAYKTLKPKMAFEDFCRWLNSDIGADTHADRHWLSQHVLLHDHDGNPLCDYVARYENLESEIALICKKIGIEPFELPKRGHISSEDSYAGRYSDETRDLITARYAKDIEVYGYEF